MNKNTKRRQARILCIEPRTLAERDQMKILLAKYGYTVIHETPENILAERQP